MHKMALTALTMLLIASEASALNRKVWDSLTREQQNIYLIGAFEVILTGEPDEPLHTYKSVLWQCYEQEKFDSDFMRELVVEELISIKLGSITCRQRGPQTLHTCQSIGCHNLS